MTALQKQMREFFMFLIPDFGKEWGAMFCLK